MRRRGPKASAPAGSKVASVVSPEYTGVVRVLASLEIDVEPEYAPYLTRFPFPERKDGGP